MPLAVSTMLTSDWQSVPFSFHQLGIEQDEYWESLILNLDRARLDFSDQVMGI